MELITHLKPFTHHCLLCAHVRLKHSQVITYKSTLGPLPSYRQTYTKQKETSSYSLRSQDLFHLSVPKIHTELGKGAFRYVAPSTWKDSHQDLELNELVTLYAFKLMLNDLEAVIKV